jgi:hypothetical protein
MRSLCQHPYRACAVAALLMATPLVRPTSTIAAPATFAAPWAILVHGSRIPAPIALADWDENQQLMLAIPGPGTAMPSQNLKGRPYVELALFWGPDWEYLHRSPGSVARLRPEQANQRGWLFLARGDEAAVVVLNPPALPALSATLTARPVGPKGIAILTQHGVPVRIP